MTLRDRFWIRGWTWLGLLNTVLACLCARVVWREVDTETGETIRWGISNASKWPRPRC